MKSKGIGKGKNTKNQPIIVDRSIGGKNKAKLNRYQKEELITKIIQWITDGCDKKTVRELIEKNSPVKLNNNDPYILINFAVKRLEEITKQDAPVVIANHMEKYAVIENYFRKVDHTSGLNKVLKAKEKLAGCLRDKNKLVVNQKKTTVIERNVEYDMSKLSPAEQKRMKELINKAK